MFVDQILTDLQTFQQIFPLGKGDRAIQAVNKVMENSKVIVTKVQ